MHRRGYSKQRAGAGWRQLGLLGEADDGWAFTPGLLFAGEPVPMAASGIVDNVSSHQDAGSQMKKPLRGSPCVTASQGMSVHWVALAGPYVCSPTFIHMRSQGVVGREGSKWLAAIGTRYLRKEEDVGRYYNLRDKIGMTSLLLPQC